MVRVPLFMLALLTANTALAEPSATAKIEARATCITHEGADLPAGSAPADKSKECSAAALDGSLCGSLEGAEEGRCLVREIATWDGVLDLLVKISADKRDRQASLRSAIAAFRTFRDKACATFQKVSINTPSPNALATCRVSESARFAQELYVHFYSP